MIFHSILKEYQLSRGIAHAVKKTQFERELALKNTSKASTLRRNDFVDKTSITLPNE
jgi:hypothetical protein